MDKDMDNWRQRTAFVGFDWAGDHHDVVLVDQHGKIVEDLRFDDTAEGWQQLIKTLSKHPDPAVAIETSGGMTVQRLLEAGYAVYPVNPKAAKRYRERKAPGGTKTDHLDAWSLADALRLDGHTWRQLKPDDPLTVELRLLLTCPRFMYQSLRESMTFRPVGRAERSPGVAQRSPPDTRPRKRPEMFSVLARSFSCFS